MGVGGPQGRFGWVRKISPTPGFDPWNVQPVASRYTDWAIPCHTIIIIIIIIASFSTFSLSLFYHKSLTKNMTQATV